MSSLTTSAGSGTAGENHAERIARLRESAYRIRRHALDMGEVQGQGYIGQALGVADILAVLYKDQLHLSGRSALAGSRPPAAVDRALRDRPVRSSGGGRRPRGLRAEHLRLGRLSICRCPGWHPTPPAWRSPVARWAMGSASRRAWRSAFATRRTKRGSTTCSPTASSTRDRLGRPRWLALTTTWTT